MTFDGFESEDFEVFSIPDFAGRMAMIRARVRPRLLALGEDLHAALEQEVGIPTFPHVAQHMRRRVNPPPETWVAYTRDRKGYKRWTHYRIVIGGPGVRVTVFVEDDADDKPAFAARLQKEAPRLLSALGPASPIFWYSPSPDGALPQSKMTRAKLRDIGAELARLKLAKFQAGVELDRESTVRMEPAAFEAWALQQMALLKPLYLAGAAG